MANSDSWNEITINITGEQSDEPAPTPLLSIEEIVSAVLTAAGADGVAIVEGNGDLAVTAYFPTDLPLQPLLSEINHGIAALADFIDLKHLAISTKYVSNSDWANIWKTYYHPTRITRYLTIIPSWNTDYRAHPDEILVRLDPDQVFGTGTHPTTKLALYALEQVIRGGETVIDVGTGSGVLAIACALLGAGDIYAYDIDSVAVQNASLNIAVNSLSDRIHLAANNLLSGIKQPANIIVANILADVLLQMIDDAMRLLLPGGHLILSGIYHDKVETIRENTTSTGLILETEMTQGDWHCLIFQQPCQI